jgi:type II secretory pathway component PulC
MKNKKLLYLLVPLTLFVWGLIIYRVFVGTKDNSFVPVRLNESKVKTDFSAPDTFSISTHYRDPFFDEPVVVKKVASSGNVKKTEVIAVPALPWPVLTYGGIIENNKSKKRAVLISINGQDAIVNVGETINDIKILRADKASIRVKYKGEEREIAK